MLRPILTGACVLVLFAACATGKDAQRTASTAGPEHMCVSATGQRVKSTQPCSVFGRSWSREDLERTGQPDIGPALQTLDPSITVHH